MQAQAERDSIQCLWDQILEILMERITHKAIPISELRHLVYEIKLILLAAKGHKAVWASVVDVALVLVEQDATIKDLRMKLPYNESTIYRALKRLEHSGFIRAQGGETMANVWTIDEGKCPVIRRACRTP